MPETNGRVKLTWGQIVWGVGIIFLLGGQFVTLKVLQADVADLKSRFNSSVYSREQIDSFRVEEAAEHQRMWKAIEERKKK